MYIIHLKTITAFVGKQLQINFILSFTISLLFPLLRLPFLSKSLIFIDPNPIPLQGSYLNWTNTHPNPFLLAILNCAIHTALLLLLHIRILAPNQVCSREGGPAQGLTAS